MKSSTNILQQSSPEAAIAAHAYEAVARHYYDTELHPTCAAFRAASLQLIRDLAPLKPVAGAIVELGAGKSSVPEAIVWWNECPIVLVDGSPTMLAYSNEIISEHVRLVTADARATGLEAGIAGLVVAGLADPYNDASLWAEIRRLLRPEGVAIITTPSFEWASHFRPSGQMADQNKAEFSSPDGILTALPSFIQSRKEQEAIITAAGLAITDVRGLCVGEVSLAAVAPKIHATPSNGSFVDAYLCRIS